MDKSLVGTDNYYGCGKRGHMVRDCPMSKTQGMDINKAQASGLNYDSLEKNHFYALQSRDDQEDSLDVVTGMFHVFLINVYDLLDPDDTLFFVIL